MSFCTYRYDHSGKDQDVTSLSSRNATGSFSDSVFLTFRQVLVYLMLISFHVYLLSSFLFFSLQIKELNQLGQQEKPDYFSCKGMIVYLKKESCLYTVLTK